MGQRSPMNQRYQKHGKPEGKTRRSAASLKPKASSGSSSSSSKSGSGGTKTVFVATPEYKMWRRIWWGLLGGALAMVVASLLLQKRIPPQAQNGVLVVYAVLLGLSVYVDYKKIRPLRKAAMVTTDDKKGS